MKVIITLTSWVKRIDTIHYTIDSILNGEMLPDYIILNLSKTEFEGIQLPEYVLNLELNNKIKINWIDGPNTKTFKKLLPTLEKFPNDIVISIDDDIIYPKNFVKVLVNAFLENPNCPITIHYHYYKGVLIPWGGGSLYKKEFLKGYEEFLDDEVISTYEDDWFYAYILVYNGIELKLAPNNICYTPERYWQSTYENQMAINHMYSTKMTKEVLDNKLKDRGVTFDELANKIYEKSN